MSSKPTRSLHEFLPLGTPEHTQLQGSLHPRVAHGGPASVGRRKTERPWNSKAPVHLLLQSRRARGVWSLAHRRHRSKIQAMIYRYAERFGVRIYRAVNHGHEIQLLVKATERKPLADFLRVLAGQVAVRVTGATKGKKRVGRFWDHLTFSKLINWGREFFEISRALLSGPIQPNPSLVASSSLDVNEPDQLDELNLPLPFS
jgi:hypothetical protein